MNNIFSLIDIETSYTRNLLCYSPYEKYEDCDGFIRERYEEFNGGCGRGEGAGFQLISLDGVYRNRHIGGWGDALKNGYSFGTGYGRGDFSGRATMCIKFHCSEDKSYNDLNRSFEDI